MQHRKTISLTAKDDTFIAAQVKTGEFGNASEVIRAGLRLLEEYQLNLRHLRGLIDQGDAAVAAGRVTVVGNRGDLAKDIVARGKVRGGKAKVA